MKQSTGTGSTPAPRTMRQELRWIRILGVLSVFPSLYFWAAMAAYELWRISIPGNPGFIVTCVLLSALASVVAAVQWTRWMYVVTAMAVSTFLFVGLRMH